MARSPHARGRRGRAHRCRAVTRGPFRSSRSIWAQRAERGQRRVKSGFRVWGGCSGRQKECRTGNGNKIEAHPSLRQVWQHITPSILFPVPRSVQTPCRRRERCTYLCRHSTTCAFHVYLVLPPPTLGLSVRPQEPHNLGFAPGYSRS